MKKLSDIKGYEKFVGYEILHDGTLLSYWDNGSGKNNKPFLMSTAKEIKDVLDNKGYVRNNIGGRNSYKKAVRRHILVAKAFIPNPYNYPQVGHKDGIKTNNHVSNLEWCTNSMNQIHSYKIGEKQLKYNEDQIKIMCENWNNMTKKQLSDLCGINITSMYDIYKGIAVVYNDIVLKYKKRSTTSA